MGTRFAYLPLWIFHPQEEETRMECPHCQQNGCLELVKVLATNLLLRVCSHCTRTWLDGQSTNQVEGIKLKEFIRARGIDAFHLIDVAENVDQKQRA